MEVFHVFNPQYEEPSPFQRTVITYAVPPLLVSTYGCDLDAPDLISFHINHFAFGKSPTNWCVSKHKTSLNFGSTHVIDASFVTYITHNTVGPQMC